MNVAEYMKDKILLLVLHMSCMLLMAGFLHATGYETGYGLLILIFWLMILTVWLGVGYYNRKCYFRELETVLEKMDQRYLLGELMPVSHRLEDRLYKELIRSSNKSVIERIRQIEDEQKEYREYIESWVHEIKAPITSIDLMCENHKEDVTRRIRLENQKIENYVDIALYYARSDEVYKDYVIQKTDLEETAVVVLNRNKRYLIQSQVQAEVDCRDLAYTDQKWITFILNQLVLNSTKYRRETGARIWIRTEKYGHGVRLIVRDNGIGIREEELGRIFEKGFTGSNGRKRERSTGMGLYLCDRLCRKLGIVINVDSREGEGTEVSLEFPVSNYLLKEESYRP
jgi:signal transduction histidine kinase